MARKYSCKNCGAELYFNPALGKLHCEYCGSDYDPSEYNYVPDEIESVDATISQSDDEGDESIYAPPSSVTDESISTDDLVVYKCPNCGAEVITSKKTVATTCIYCNRAITFSGNITGDFRPDYVLPFAKDRKEVEEAYRRLCHKSFLTPRKISSDSTVEKIKGIYVPYWLYTFEGSAAFRVRAARINTYKSGDEEITETKRYELTEEGRGDFERIPADAMKEMDNNMMDSIEPFDFTKLEKFNPAYLTGFYTQRWDDSSSRNEYRAKTRAKEALSQKLLGSLDAYDSTAVEDEDYNWRDHKIEMVMLPVWMLYTEYKGKKYVFGMNGQTGKMSGEVPKDPVRLIEIGLIFFIISQIVMMIIRIGGTW